MLADRGVVVVWYNTHNMGCRMSRTSSTEDCRKVDEKNTSGNSQTNGQSRNPPNDSYRSSQNANALQIAGKPIIEVESASQADFFRMLDDKIAHGKDLDSETES